MSGLIFPPATVLCHCPMSSVDHTLPGDSAAGECDDSAESDPRLGRRFGPYRVCEKLNRGGTGAVYVGYDTLLNRQVAMKFLSRWLSVHPRAVRRFAREAAVAARLNHPNILCVYDLLQEGADYVLVLELLHAVSAGRRLQKGPYHHRVATRIAAECCLALIAAHQAGLIHRDIKPDNVLFTLSGYVKLIDFGMVKLMEEGQSLTGSKSLCGTPHFMSPEQALRKKADVRSDIYSLGALYYALLTGWPPFPGGGLVDLLRSHVSAPTPDPRAVLSSIPEACASIIERAMQKSPALRYQTAVEMSAALEALAGAGTSRRASIFVLDKETPLTGLRLPPGWSSAPSAQSSDNPFLGRADIMQASCFTVPPAALLTKT